MKLILRRVDKNDRRVYGRIEADGGRIVVPHTLEEPWRDENGDGLGDTGRSCIPAGEYPVFLRKSRLHGGTGKRTYDVPELRDVPGRSHVQIHIGNTLADTEGCILVGSVRSQQKTLDDGGCVLGSRPAFDRLMEELVGEVEWTLEVCDP